MTGTGLGSFPIGSAPSTAVQSVFNMTLSSLGPKVVPWQVDMSTPTLSVEVDLTYLIQQGAIDFVSGAWIDNTENTEILRVVIFGTNQVLEVPAGNQGYFPMLSPEYCKFTFECNTTPDIIIPVIFYNIPLLPYQWNKDGLGTITIGGTVDVDIVSSITVPVSIASTLNVSRVGSTITDRSNASLSGVSQQLCPAASGAGRRTFFVQNLSSTNNMGINFNNGVAAIGTAGTVTLLPFQSMLLDNGPPQLQINIIGTAGDDVTCFEGD